MKCKKAQASLETIILMAALFAFFALWLPVAFNVKSGFDSAIAGQYEAVAQNDVQQACRAVQEMGSGSQRIVEISVLNAAQIDACNPKIKVGAGKSELLVWHEMKCRCELIRR